MVSFILQGQVLYSLPINSGQEKLLKDVDDEDEEEDDNEELEENDRLEEDDKLEELEELEDELSELLDKEELDTLELDALELSKSKVRPPTIIPAESEEFCKYQLLL